FARTASRISRTAAPTSSAVSRLPASSAANCASKSGAAVSSRFTISCSRSAGVFAVFWLAPGAPDRAHVLQFRLDAFHVKADCAAAGELKRDITFGRIGLLELDREEVQDGIALVLADALDLAGQHPVEAQGGAAALEAFLARSRRLLRAFPV